MNPYGIEQVNIPGVLNAYMGQQQARTQQILAQRQMEQAERQAERENGIRAAVARYAMGAQGGSSSSAGSASPTTAAPSLPPGGVEGVVQTMTAQPQAPAAAPASAAQAPTAPAAGNRQQLFNELLALDPEQAFQTMRAFAQMDEAQFQQVTRSYAVMAREAMRLQPLPYEQRRAEIARVAPQLQQLGLSPEQISGFDPTDANLSMIVNQARDVEKLAEDARPRLRAVEGELLDENRLGRGQDPVVWRSEYMNGPGGIYRRPNAGVAGGEAPPAQQPVRVSTPEEARQLPPGTPILLPDGTIGVVPGGPQASPSAGGFPW